MSLKQVIVLIAASFHIAACSSGAGSGSDEEYFGYYHQTQSTDTVIHEITNDQYVDTSSDYVTTAPAMPDEQPCKTKGDCGVTVASSATHVISLHIEDEDVYEEAFTKPSNSKYISENGYYYLKSETQKVVNAILDKIDSSERVLPRFEKNVYKRLDALELGIERVLESVKISHLKSSETKSEVIPELVATETWSYIDSKFTELKSKLIEANEKIKSDFEARINEVLKTYDQRPSLKNPHRNESGSYKKSVINVLTRDVSHKSEGDSSCRHCCQVLLKSKIESPQSNRKDEREVDNEDLPGRSILIEQDRKSSPVNLRWDHRSSKTVEGTDNGDHSSVLGKLARLTHDGRHKPALTKFWRTENRMVDGLKRSVGDSVVIFRSDLRTREENKDSTRHMTLYSDSPTHCGDVYAMGQRKSGVYSISPLGHDSFEVYCDMDTDGGGWTVLQRRTFGNVNFTRGWQDYKYGFGVVTGDYWMGLERMHILSGLLRQAMSLRVDLKDWSNVSQYAHYNLFKIQGEEQDYRIHLKDYYGTAGNAMQYTPGGTYNHNRQRFTTIDRDNDAYRLGSCGRYYGAGWWFNSCFAANLNGKYYRGMYKGIRDGIYWGTWYRLNDAATNSRHSFKFADMKIRPVDFKKTAL